MSLPVKISNQQDIQGMLNSIKENEIKYRLKAIKFSMPEETTDSKFSIITKDQFNRYRNEIADLVQEVAVKFQMQAKSAMPILSTSEIPEGVVEVEEYKKVVSSMLKQLSFAGTNAPKIVEPILEKLPFYRTMVPKNSKEMDEWNDLNQTLISAFNGLKEASVEFSYLKGLWELDLKQKGTQFYYHV